MDMITGPGGESPDTDDFYEKYKDLLDLSFAKILREWKRMQRWVLNQVVNK